MECQIDLRHGIEKLVLLRTTDTKHNCVNLTFKAFVELDKMGFIPSLWDILKLRQPQPLPKKPLTLGYFRFDMRFISI